MKEIEPPQIAVPPQPVNAELWRRVLATLTTGRAIEIASLDEAGYSSLQSLRCGARARAKRLRARAHVAKTGAGYAVWFTKA